MSNPPAASNTGGTSLKYPITFETQNMKLATVFAKGAPFNDPQQFGIRQDPVIYRCSGMGCRFRGRTLADLEAHSVETMHNCFVDPVSGCLVVPSGLEDGFERLLRAAGRRGPGSPKIAPAGIISRGELPSEFPSRVLDLMLPIPPQYRCFECGRVFGSFPKLERHMRSEGHCKMECFECAQEGRSFLFDWDAASPNSVLNHARSTIGENALRAHTAVMGVQRTVDSMTLPRNLLPSVMPAQFACPICVVPNAPYAQAARVTFREKFLLAAHMLAHHADKPQAADMMRQLHAEPPCCLQCGDGDGLPNDLATAVRHYLQTEHLILTGVQAAPATGLDKPDPAKQAQSRQVHGYQCHECFKLSTDRDEFYAHLNTTGHTLPLCASCGESLGPDPASARQHRERTGHDQMFGTFMQPYFYVVSIDATDPDVALLLDENELEGERVDPGWRNNTARMVYQCPMDVCLRVFMTAEEAIDHLEQTKHGMLRCDECDILLRSWDGVIANHPHKNELTPLHHLYRRNHIDDFKVFFSEFQISAHYANCAHVCEACGMVVANALDDAHRAQECKLRQKVKQAKGGDGSRVQQSQLPKVTHVSSVSCSTYRTETVDAQAFFKKNNAQIGAASAAASAAAAAAAEQRASIPAEYESPSAEQSPQDDSQPVPDAAPL